MKGKRWFVKLGWALAAVFVVWMWWAQDTAGVRLSNEIPERARTEVQTLGLEEGEEVVAFNEFSLGTLTEYAALTDRRLLYFKDGRTTVLEYGDMTSIEMTDASIGADIVIVSTDGQVLRLALANDPELFLRVLKEQKKNAVAETEIDSQTQNDSARGPRTEAL